jgi:ABC-type nitrate/sulfonate/bicarbonate transport system ATPase subunit
MRLAMVSQEGDLLPWMNIQDNVALGLEIRGVRRRRRLARARRTLRRLRLPDDVARALPHQLSGGMRQRVALARALCSQPEVLLMDEPFASLDEPTRYHLQDLLIDVWRSSRRTILFVTHSLEEAVYLADRIVILAGGRIRGEMTLDLPRPRDRMGRPFIARMLEVRELFARAALEGQVE